MSDKPDEVKATFILKESAKEKWIKELMLFNQPTPLKVGLSSIGWRILLSLLSGPKYPAQVAKELGMYRQRIYYYIKRLAESGLIHVVREQAVAGGLAKYYCVTSPAFGVELPFGERRITTSKVMDEQLKNFLYPIVDEGEFRGKIVVGSPEPHGPNKTTARDGHYGVHLGFFLGQYCNLPSDFAVKLDVDVKSEKEEKSHLILIGGPGTNLLTADVNRHLPIRFNESNYWAGLMDRSGGVYSADSNGVIAKIRNPFDPSKTIIVLAGVRHVGTKSAIIGLANYYREVLKGYKGEEDWAVAIRGFDLDADGKVDSVEVVSKK